MTIHAKLFVRAAAVVLVATTAVTVGTAFGLGSGLRLRRVRAVARARGSARRHGAGEPSTVGAAAMPRCDLLPENYIAQDESVRAGGGESLNVWAAGDAAVARYFNELARLCEAGR